MKVHTIKTYSFDELESDSQETAICNHIQFWLDTYNPDCDCNNENLIRKAIQYADKMQTPWFAANYVYEYAKQDVIDEIKANEYEFYANGELFNFKGMG